MSRRARRTVLGGANVTGCTPWPDATTLRRIICDGPGAAVEARMLRSDAGEVSTSRFVGERDLPIEKKPCMAPTEPKPRKC